MGLFGALFGGSSRLSRDEVKERVAAGALLVDVRTPAEFAAGHPAGAKNLPLQDLPRRFAELPRDREIILYCRSGARSSTAFGMLQAKGYEKLHDAGALGNVM